MSDKMEFWSMQAGECPPNEVTLWGEKLMQSFFDGHPGAEILRVDHQTCSIGSPSSPRIMLTMLIHFQI